MGAVRVVFSVGTANCGGHLYHKALVGGRFALSEILADTLTYYYRTKRSPFQPSPFDYDDSAGGGVDVYVFDSGVTSDQDQFGGRVIDEVNVSDEPFADQTGHGSKVASLIASRDYGVSTEHLMMMIHVCDRLTIDR